MSDIDLGFGDDGSLRVNKSADTEETLAFPSSYDFDGYTGKFQIRADEASTTALLSVTETANANGSKLTFDGASIVLLLKKADLADLPDDATDTSDPWVGVYQWVITDTDGLTTQLVAGSLTAEKGVVR